VADRGEGESTNAKAAVADLGPGPIKEFERAALS
jgi:hypothetical protein